MTFQLRVTALAILAMFFFRFFQNPKSFLSFLLSNSWPRWLYCVAFWTLGNASCCRRLEGMEPRLARLDGKLRALYRPQRCLAGLLLQGVLLLQPPCCTAAAAASCSLCWCSLLCDLAKVGSSTLLRLHLDKAKQPVSETASTSPQISAHWY